MLVISLKASITGSIAFQNSHHGWDEDYGDLAVHITTLDDESNDRPLQAANGPTCIVTRVHHRIMDDSPTYGEKGPPRHAKGRRLPRPKSNMGQGVLFSE